MFLLPMLYVIHDIHIEVTLPSKLFGTEDASFYHLLLLFFLSIPMH